MGLTDIKFPFSNARVASRRNSLTIESDRVSSPIPSSNNQCYDIPARKARHKFRSYRLKGEYSQPWLDDKRLKRTKYGNIIVWIFVLGAVCVSGYLSYDGAKNAKTGDYCLILDDHFNGIDDAVWSHEVQIGGFGTGSFDWTTADKKNSFTDADGLHIVPTLTTETAGITEEQIFNGYTLNLTKTGDGDGTCTSTDYKACSIHSNATTGATIPPVRSARLSTKGKKSIKYGRIEVTAKMPRGDWLWPAIWMMPEENKYGEWPASGEIDIMEMRGNSWKYPLGRDAMVSSLHWGPSSKLDAYWRTYGTKFLRRTDFTDDYHTFGLQWSKEYLFTYLDSRLKQVFYMKFGSKESMWERGHFEGQTVNQTVVENPWSKTGNTNTPFDEKFYLILNVAVGAQNGWFFDGKFNKPWVDNGVTAVADFAKAQDKWLPTWGEGNARGMTVKSVKMWQEGKC
ncbi:concanavalin A-like lectin/glucanase [Lindgomyces ingoldianus]|uniref:Concanavalin A-like lectin/glucanase n=1 Tax=Lindgomyces ingoldianus TaxID=673940 RepID=A0ACB6RBL5_9PLEO|nr:concanavalin A-like lectin/glucanase [Lindgomyces ingoldianus]KAF2475917.1 concanavalin A-like lectin/glucanase [Lindgomyces ingoldianus]